MKKDTGQTTCTAAETEVTALARAPLTFGPCTFTTPPKLDPDSAGLDVEFDLGTIPVSSVVTPMVDATGKFTLMVKY
jgi:hypothetical protein